MHPESAAKPLALDTRAHLTFLITERGAPFTSAGFGNWFRDRCNLAGLPQCSAHGLRKAHVVRRANSGASAEQLMASKRTQVAVSACPLHTRRRPGGGFPGRRLNFN